LILSFSTSSCRDDLTDLAPNPDLSQEFSNGRIEKGVVTPIDDDDDGEDDSESMVLGYHDVYKKVKES
jgi:hypothetical protein